MQPKPKPASAGGIPKGWPPGTVYLRAACYSKKMPSDVFKALVFPKSDLPAGTQVLKTAGPYSNVKITSISSAPHPANGQNGLFASQNLSPDSFILPYLGYVHDSSETNEASDYDLSLDRERGIGVDASQMGNEARFINDYRGVSTAGPNAEFRDIFVHVGNGKVERRVGVFVLSAGKSGKRSKGIARGEEILVSYGKGFWTERLSTEG
ncbi:hypothetical protein BS50DRAFT_68937 [Corynespora cassiicola Philippines]|uniref:SET domain-containing protein n=1 Tax=Corynespora cassiicola Philippines TaxID=1448308 RepID=A0A2T2NGW9_CORCC|nr:hypothetical protein BS50DRAFT_68937 [Corynespora cassiicola Philippines]